MFLAIALASATRTLRGKISEEKLILGANNGNGFGLFVELPLFHPINYPNSQGESANFKGCITREVPGA